MKKLLLICSGILVLAAAFFLGIWWQQFVYDDICLDMGGGRNPGDHPICVIEKN